MRFITLYLTIFATILLSPIDNVVAQSYTLPSNFDEATCTFQTESFEMSIIEKFRSEETNVSTYFSAVVGDLDGDGYGEIVIPGGEHNKSQYIFIFNHKAELIRRITLVGATMDPNHDSVILADLDNDGKSEIIVTASNGGQLMFIFDHEGKLITSVSNPSKFPKTVGVVDFNNDGIPEIYVGTRIYGYANRSLSLLADGGNALGSTVAQDIDGDGIPELISVNTVYKVTLNSLTNPALNSANAIRTCSAINTISQERERTFALADIDLDGSIDVITVLPKVLPELRLEVKVWNVNTGALKYSLNINLDKSAGVSILRNSWPFIGDTDADGYPDIIFMGGLASKGHTSVYRLEYDATSGTLAERARNSGYNDYSSMSTSMSMFDFNNDGKQEIIYRDEVALYIINGETLQAEQTIPDCHSGTGWEYPVVASLTPSGESSIIMCSSEKTPGWISTGSVRIYGADIANGAKPWMPARKIWNQYSFYQNTINDDLKIIANPAPINVTLTSDDGLKTMQPFNGHMSQLGIIKRSTLESVFPIANAGIEIIDFGYNRVTEELILDLEIGNLGSAAMDPNIPVNLYKIVGTQSTLIGTTELTKELLVDEFVSVSLNIGGFDRHLPFDKLVVKIAEGKYDCDPIDNEYTILPENISNVFYVQKGKTGKGSTWQDAMGELSEALQIANERNTKYPYSITQLWVAEGTYADNFEMQEGVNIYGGFAGVETAINESRPLENPTVLDARGSGRPLTQLADYTVTTEWRGLTLVNGNTTANGGGASLKKGSTLSYSIVKNNKTSATKGGGIYGENTRVVNCIIEQNEITNTTSGEGAGIYAINNSYIVNNTIVKNKISAPSANGAGLYTSASTASNNIIYKNTANSSVNNLFSQGGTVSNNLANNDDSVDPLFVKFEEGNYKLLPISPSLNIGDNTFIADWEQDIEGNERIYQGKIVDQGAIEYQGAKVIPSEEGYFFVNNAKNGDGADWTGATKELSDALLGAKYLNENTPNSVSEIWVAEGTYLGALEMVEGVNVHGGFAGNETDFNQIDPVANKTYIDAQGNGRVLTQSEDFDTPTEWAGFILQNGNETGIDYDVYGGGAYLKKNGTLRYSTIKNSKATATSIHNKVNAYGGGVYMEKGANLLHCIIDNNVAEVVNTQPATIAYGVAQGGGVNNVKNRLPYLVVRNNKAISQNNTDGGAIYSSGDIVNSVINNNTGQSTIYMTAGVAAINNTIVGNAATEYTIAGSSTAKLQNSILYNNVATIADIHQVTHASYNNLINKDPKFQTGSFVLTDASPARLKGNTSFFPQDLDKDMDGKLRIISLSNNTKVIDIGAYQTYIKVESATEIKIVVPFGTDFSDINFKEFIAGFTEANFGFKADVDWLEGLYNKLKDGDYTLAGNLSNLPEGVVNPNNVKGTIIISVAKNHVPDMVGLMVNGEDWLSRLAEAYIIDCESDLSKAPIKINLPHFGTIAFDQAVEYTKLDDEVTLELDVLKPGNHTLKATVTSQDGKHTVDYQIVLVKYFPFWDIIEQRWNNTFVINNNEETNGGYKFVSYKWYKLNAEIGTKQYYSAGGTKNDVLDEPSLYHAEMIDVNGIKYTTCQARPVLMYSGIKVVPNPVKVGESISISSPMIAGQTGQIIIYSLSGMIVTQTALQEGVTVINTPMNTGIYIVKVSIKGGVSESVRLIVY